MEAISTCGRKCAENFVDFLGALAVALGMSVDEDGVRTKLGRRAQRHGGMDSELAGCIGGRGNHAALVALSADHDWLAFQRWIEEFFDGHEEGVHVDVEDGAGEAGLLRCSHAGRILAAMFTTNAAANKGVIIVTHLCDGAQFPRFFPKLEL